MKKAISIILIIVGLLLIASPYISKLVIKQKMKNASSSDITAEMIVKNNENEAEYDFSSVTDIDISGTLLSPNKIDKNLIIGQLVVPSINLNLSIIKGLNNTNLLAGAATMRPDQKLGEGNYPLAGHFIKQKDILFGGLMDIKNGDIIRVTDKKDIYEYKVYETVAVPDDAVYMIEDKKSQERGKPVISLMTCYYSSKTGKRYFVMGELENKIPYDEKLMNSKQ